MGEGPTIDARMQAALARLTDNEKECLRRRLQQQTAKEMALELGVSPHAVEKRLKMARTKLGLSSSLEAARLLAAFDGYQQTGPRAPDLEIAAARGDNRFHRKIALGATAMIVLAATALAVVMQPSEPGVAARAGISVQADERDWIEATPETIRAFLTDGFTLMDKDKSGFVDRSEVLGYGLIQGSSPPDVESLSEAEIEEGRRRWIAVADRNDDRLVSLDEYIAWQLPVQRVLGVPANWRGLTQAAAD